MTETQSSIVQSFDGERIEASLREVRYRIHAAALAAGRAASDVELIAVSKRQPTAAIRHAYAAGQRDFGENYVQELVQKAAELADLTDLRWHLIGHLQRNKARSISGLVSRVHTVDSSELARELARRVVANQVDGRPSLAVLIEVSIAGEAQKKGVSPDALPALLDEVERLPGLSLRGLMCVPPLTASSSDARPFFEKLTQLRDRHGGATRLPELSMGMTRDLEQAIAAGATWVRVGTAIFGERVAASSNVVETFDASVSR